MKEKERYCEMRKLASVSYYLLFVMGLLLVLLANISKNTDIYEKYEKNPGTEITPSAISDLSEDVREYVFSGVSWEDDTTLLFYSSHQCVRVYADDDLIYAVEASDTVLGKTPGAYLNFVEIPADVHEITVELEAVYPQVRSMVADFYIGNARAMFREIIYISIPSGIVSVTDILIGFFMFLYWGISKKRENEQRSCLYFSFFAFALGCWSLNTTAFMQLLLPNRVGASFSSYVFLMLMTIPYLYFTDSFLQMDKKYGTNIIGVCYSVIYFALAILHFTGVREFKQTVIVIHIMIVIEFIYCTIAILLHARIFGTDRRVKVSSFGIIAFFIAFVVDMAAYYLGKRAMDLFARVALLIYIFLLGYEILLETLEMSKENQKTEIYRELAMKDTMTGLYNRNAYNQWLEQHGPEKDIAVLMCDLNDLKKCNDTKGHAAGDSYIMGAADIISRVFGKEGVCYRIGGDEFCVILTNAGTINLADKVRELSEMEAECNRMLAEMRIHIACGYAVFDRELDKNIEDTCRRADREMYRNKKEGKKRR